MIFLDTSAAIDVMRGRRPEVRRRYAEARASGAQVLLSSIVLFELRFGVCLGAHQAENSRQVDGMLNDGVALIPFDADDAKEAGELRAILRKAGREIGPYDLLIAAQARRRGAALVTHNLTEFARVPGLVAVDWVD